MPDALISPFRVRITGEAVDDLRGRLVRTRWPEPATTPGWQQGTPLPYAQGLCTYWADGYDFAAAEGRLNRHPQFRTEIDGLAVHFVHVRSSRPHAVPLVMTHGWPGSVAEFAEAVTPLAEPPPGELPRRAVRLESREVRGLDRQSRRDPDPRPASRQPDALLAPATAASVARPYRESFPEVQALFRTGGTDVVAVPTACSVFPRELPRPSRRWAARRFPDLRYWNEPPRGGHFAAFEQPTPFVAELRAAARALMPSA